MNFIDREIGRIEVLSAEGSILQSGRLYQGYIVMLKMCYVRTFAKCFTVAVISFDDHGFPPPRYYWLDYTD